MKKVRQLNKLLLIFAALMGLCLGGCVALFCLSLGEKTSILTLIGLIVAIVSGVFAVLLVYLVQRREAQIARVNNMFERFGKEVDFLRLDAFLKALKNRRNVNRLYAIHLSLPSDLGDMDRRVANYALVDAVSNVVGRSNVIGYTEFGDIIVCTTESEETVVDWAKRVDEALSKRDEMPSFSLLLGASETKEDYEKMLKEAEQAANSGEELRESCSLVVYQEKTDHLEKIDLSQEMKQERLNFYVTPFQKDEERVLILEPSLYNAYRGELRAKELFHVLTLWDGLAEIDEISVERAMVFLSSNPDEKLLGIRVSEEGIADDRLHKFVVDKAAEYGIERSRILLMFFSPSLVHRKNVQSVRKAKGLGFGVGVYEYGGEAVENLIKFGVEYIEIKPELVRKNADPIYLKKLLDGLKAMNMKPLIEEGKLLEEESFLTPLETIRLPRLEEEEE